ncbi:hypothetical protein [Bacillus toyonensis]|nr:hypothetical protein [Bacillus toyonensis]
MLFTVKLVFFFLILFVTLFSVIPKIIKGRKQDVIEIALIIAGTTFIVLG